VKRFSKQLNFSVAVHVAQKKRRPADQHGLRGATQVGRTVAAVTIEQLTDRLRAFADERDWHQFHTPKNLAMALAGEAGELLELFQWLTPQQSATVMTDPDTATKVRAEMADVLSYLLRLADVLEIDLLAALSDKIDLNEMRYPVDQARGNARKYDQM
jgi:NTP pyrophosphatase (non-canonical NTP hydrolase)